MHLKLTKHGRFCKKNNQLLTKIHDELKDNFITKFIVEATRSLTFFEGELPLKEGSTSSKVDGGLKKTQIDILYGKQSHLGFDPKDVSFSVYYWFSFITQLPLRSGSHLTQFEF